MDPRFHRALGAFVLLALLTLSGLATLLGNAQAQTRQLTGLVTECSVLDPDPVSIAGATVTLIDADGSVASVSTVTGPSGTYSFSTPALTPGYYRLHVDKQGYFDGGTEPIRFDGTTTIFRDVCLVKTPTLDKTVLVRVLRASTGAAIVNASIEVVFVPRQEVVVSARSNTTGYATIRLWGDTRFELRTNATGLALDQRALDTNTTSSVVVSLGAGIEIVGWARNADGFVSAGLEGYLYNTDPSAEPESKIVTAAVEGPKYTFNVSVAGTYKMVIDANGHRANVSTQVLAAGPLRRIDAVLDASPEEEYRTTVAYGTGDWNNLTIYRNLTLNPDTTLVGLNPPGLRDLRLQVDFTFGGTTGTRNGLVSGAESTAFTTWFKDNGPFYTTTDGFFTTNGKAHISSALPAAYTVTVAGLTTPGSRVWINTTATYTLKDTPPYILPEARRYFVNVTGIGDRNVSVYQDYVFEIILPRRYEMTSATPFGTVTTSGFTNVTVDPGVTTSAPQVRLTVEKSLSGSARAKVAAPIGKFHVVNASFDNYQAFVANNTTLTFSAEDSIDPIGDITDANFTWRPYANVSGSLSTTKVFGIRADHKYDRSGEFLVNLTVVEAGGNVTYRNITLWVDDQTPVARMRTNRTGPNALANGTVLRVNEDTRVRFDGAPSSDQAFVNRSEGGNKTGVILSSGFAWDFDEDGITDASTRVVNWTFANPGNFTVNLTVTDSVGWNSTNASIVVIVNDTTKPTPAFDILDPANEWEVTTTLTETMAYSFNASKSTDNYDKTADLNYTWTIPGPIVGRTGTTHKFYGQNITFTWSEFNSSYPVQLNVTDTGFGSGIKNTGELSRSVPVIIKATDRPDLRVEATTLKVNPTDPEDGSSITVEVNVTNRLGRGSAGNVTTRLSTSAGGQTTVLTTTATWKNKDGSPRTNGTIGAGETITLVFVAPVTGQGNKSVEVFVSADREPFTQVGPDNRASRSITVRPSIIQQFGFVGAFLGVIVIFILVMIHRRRVRTGKSQPWRLPRREREEGEAKPKKEVKEEKKRL